MRPRVREAQPEQRAAHRRVAMRRALALEIWKERHALGAGRNRRRLGVEPLVRFARAHEIARELIAIPGERAAGRQHDAHEVPHARRDVTERMRAEPRIDARLRGRREHGARRPPARHRFTRSDRTHARGAARIVRAAADDRRSDAEVR